MFTIDKKKIDEREKQKHQFVCLGKRKEKPLSFARDQVLRAPPLAVSPRLALLSKREHKKTEKTMELDASPAPSNATEQLDGGRVDNDNNGVGVNAHADAAEVAAAASAAAAGGRVISLEVRREKRGGENETRKRDVLLFFSSSTSFVFFFFVSIASSISLILFSIPLLFSFFSFFLSLRLQNRSKTSSPTRDASASDRLVASRRSSDPTGPGSPT